MRELDKRPVRSRSRIKQISFQILAQWKAGKGGKFSAWQTAMNDANAGLLTKQKANNDDLEKVKDSMGLE